MPTGNGGLPTAHRSGRPVGVLVDPPLHLTTPIPQMVTDPHTGRTQTAAAPRIQGGLGLAQQPRHLIRREQPFQAVITGLYLTVRHSCATIVTAADLIQSSRWAHPLVVRCRYLIYTGDNSQTSLQVRQHNRMAPKAASAGRPAPLDKSRSIRPTAGQLDLECFLNDDLLHVDTATLTGTV